MTSVATKDTTTALATWGEEAWESDGTEAYDALPGDIRIVYAVSKMEGADQHVGQFWNSDRDGEDAFSKTMELVPLIVRESRVLFEDGVEEPGCRSSDGKRPDPDMPIWKKPQGLFGKELREIPPEPTSCESCPLGRWSEAEDARPPCRKNLNVLGMRSDQTAANLRVSGGNIRILTTWIRRNVVNKRRPLFSYRWLLSTARQSKGQNIWYDVVVDAESVPIEEARAYNQLVREQRQRFEDHSVDDYDAADQRVSPLMVADEHDYSGFWADYDSDIGLPRADLLKAIAPKILSDFNEVELYDLIVRFGKDLEGRDPNTLDDGERRLLVERVRGELAQAGLRL